MIKGQSAAPKRSTLETILPDLTPMLDVMFILLIFFILTANSVPFTVDVTLPNEDARTAKAVNKQPIRLTIYKQNNDYGVNNARYSNFDSASKAILELAKKGNRHVVIAGDKHASLEKFMKSLVFLQNHGLQTADILIDKP